MGDLFSPYFPYGPPDSLGETTDALLSVPSWTGLPHNYAPADVMSVAPHSNAATPRGETVMQFERFGRTDSLRMGSKGIEFIHVDHLRPYSYRHNRKKSAPRMVPMQKPSTQEMLHEMSVCRAGGRFHAFSPAC